MSWDVGFSLFSKLKYRLSNSGAFYVNLVYLYSTRLHRLIFPLRAARVSRIEGPRYSGAIREIDFVEYLRKFEAIFEKTLTLISVALGVV
jgi:hypothetical protein